MKIVSLDEWKRKQDEYVGRYHRAWERSADRRIVTARRHVAQESYVAKHRRFLTEFCALRGRVLDIGCGSMVPILRDDGLDLTRQPHFAYFGIDPEAEFSSWDYPFVQAMGEWLPFKKESFDTVITVSALDHCLNPEQVIAEAARVLRPGGMLYVASVLHIPWSPAGWVHEHALPVLRRWMARLRGRTPPEHEEHVNPMTRRRLSRALQAASLRLVRQLLMPHKHPGSRASWLQATKG